MQRLEKSDLVKLIEKRATEKDNCYYYEMYSDGVQDMLMDLYEALWRFNLREAQIIYVMNEVLSHFKRYKNSLQKRTATNKII